MITTIIKQLWNKRRANAWIFIELVLAAYFLWSVTDSLYFYTGNYLNPGRIGKGGCAYGPHHGFCLETHFYPDAINNPTFPSPALPAGKTYSHETALRFTCRK